MSALRAVVVTAALAACGDDAGFPDAPPLDGPPPGGTLSLRWSIVDQDGEPLTCQRIGAQAVTLTLRSRAISGGQTEVFGCDIEAGTTPVLAVGEYEVGIELVGTPPAGTLDTIETVEGIVVESENNTPLDPAVFTVNATGNLALTVNANIAGGNCAGGAGITSMTLAMRESPGGACFPVTFNISAGTTSGAPASTYMATSCDAPVAGPCIETDQVVTVTGIPTNSYQLAVRGNIDATSCFQNNDVLAVPPAMATLTRTLNLGRTCPP
jgi:hypothetical protein